MEDSMFSGVICFLSYLLGIIFFIVSSIASVQGQDKSSGRPPANVTVATVKTGMVAPQAEFIGTVFYKEVSDVASELEGLAQTVKFEEGQRVKKGQILVELGSEILRKDFQATLSSYQQALSELEIAKIELRRKEQLLETKSISRQSYDQDRFRTIILENRAASLKAQVERIEIELNKKVIRAPYDAIIIKRYVDRGEWIAEGKSVAILAKDDIVDILVEVPERFIQFIKKGLPVTGKVNGHRIEGSIFTIVPRGDIATRTIPVKIRMPNEYSLIEGMSAQIILPTDERKEAFIVPRDTVISISGQNVIFAVIESKAVKLPVNIVGYEGLSVGIEARDLEAGLLVVKEGNERLVDGQEVSY
jgi:RND family efflux transporter MFP subunit